MKDMIERYIYAVVRRLPEQSQAEIKNELRSNIYDMLPENPTDQQIEAALIGLGSPRDLAVKYQPKERFVVSPRFYDDYLYTLKIVAIVFALISVASGLIEAILTPIHTDLFEKVVEIIASIFANAFQSLFTSFALVTLVFWIIEQVNLKKGCCEWKIADLPELPKPNTLKISRTEVIFEIIFGTVFSVIWIMVLSQYHPLIGYYVEGELIESFFNPLYLPTYVVLFVISLGVSLLVSAVKLIKGQYTTGVALVYTLYEVMNAVLVISFLTIPDLIRPEFFEAIALDSGVAAEVIASGVQTGFTVLTVVVAIGTIIGLITTWAKIIRFEKRTISVKK